MERTVEGTSEVGFVSDLVPEVAEALEATSAPVTRWRPRST